MCRFHEICDAFVVCSTVPDILPFLLYRVPHLCEPVSLLRRALSLVCRIAQSKYHRSLVVGSHRSQEVLGEGSAHCGGADGGSRLQFLTDLLQTEDVLKVLRVELLLMTDTATLTILRSTEHT